MELINETKIICQNIRLTGAVIVCGKIAKIRQKWLTFCHSLTHSCKFIIEMQNQKPFLILAKTIFT